MLKPEERYTGGPNRASLPVRVLVVDDSAYMRKMLRFMLERSPLVEVIGTARDGLDALEQAQQLRPDVVTVDLYMPVLDGVGFIREQMARQPLPIVLVSSAQESGAEVIAAMEAGALEFVQKPTAQALDTVLAISEELLQAVMAAAAVPFEKLAFHLPEPAAPPPAAARVLAAQRTRALLIGVSTGGPRALRYLLPRFPAGFPVPVAIVLHMPIGYTQPLAEKLNELSSLEVLESAEGLEMLPGRALLAQAGLHTRLKRAFDGTVVASLSREPVSHLYTPSVDELFQSAADVYRDGALGVVLTGMGSDGTAGAAWIKAQGGRVVAEDESTSVVYGMPRSVVEAGLADQVVPLDNLLNLLLEML